MPHTNISYTKVLLIVMIIVTGGAGLAFLNRTSSTAVPENGGAPQSDPQSAAVAPTSPNAPAPVAAPLNVDPMPETMVPRVVSSHSSLADACSAVTGTNVCVIDINEVAELSQRDAEIGEWLEGDLLLEYDIVGGSDREMPFVCLGIGYDRSRSDLQPYGVCATPSGYLINADLDPAVGSWAAVDGDEREQEPAAGNSGVLRIHIAPGGAVEVGSAAHPVGSRAYVGEQQGPTLMKWLISSGVILTSGVRLRDVRRMVSTQSSVIQ